MDFGADKSPVEVIKKEHLEEAILQISILVLIINGIKTHGKNLMSSRILIKSIIVQVIMLVLKNMVLSVVHH